MGVRRNQRTTRRRRAVIALPLVASMLLLMTACGAQSSSVAPGGDDTITVFAAYATQIEEPWDGVIHAALNAEMEAGRIEYSSTTSATPATWSACFANRGAGRARHHLRRLVRQRGGRPRGRGRLPGHRLRLRVGWRTGGAQLLRLRQLDPRAGVPRGDAGRRLTESNVLGVVGGYPVPEVNRIINAFIAGAQETNQDVEVKVTFINSWFDRRPPRKPPWPRSAPARTSCMPSASVIEAAQRRTWWRSATWRTRRSAPENVVTSVTWNMAPTVTT